MIFPGFVQFPYFIRIYAFTEEKTSAMCTGTAQNSGNAGNKGLGSDSVEKNAIKTAGGEKLFISFPDNLYVSGRRGTDKMKSFTVIDIGHGKRVPENVYCRIRKENIRNSGKNKEPKQHFDSVPVEIISDLPIY